MDKQKNKRCVFMKIYPLARMQMVSYIAEMHTFCVDCLDERVLGEKLTFRICTVANRTAFLSIFSPYTLLECNPNGVDYREDTELSSFSRIESNRERDREREIEKIITC